MRHKSGTPGQCGVIDGLRHQRGGVTLSPTSLVSDQWAYCPDDRATTAGEGLSSADRVICSPRVQGAVQCPAMCNILPRRLPAAPNPPPPLWWRCRLGLSVQRQWRASSWRGGWGDAFVGLRGDPSCTLSQFCLLSGIADMGLHHCHLVAGRTDG